MPFWSQLLSSPQALEQSKRYDSLSGMCRGVDGRLDLVSLVRGLDVSPGHAARTPHHRFTPPQPPHPAEAPNGELYPQVSLINRCAQRKAGSLFFFFFAGTLSLNSRGLRNNTWRIVGEPFIALKRVWIESAHKRRNSGDAKGSQRRHKQEDTLIAETALRVSGQDKAGLGVMAAPNGSDAKRKYLYSRRMTAARGTGRKNTLIVSML